ncbi:MAG: dTMP kinase [Paraclostridium sp.]
MYQKPVFITIEGIDGVGKTTLIEHLKNAYVHKVVFIKSLSDSFYAKEAKKMLKNDTNFNTTLFMNLCLLDIAYLSKTVVIPALKAGKTVVCDRWYHSTYSYYVGFSENQSQSISLISTFINSLKLAKPDIIYLLNCPIDIAANRMRERNQTDAFEKNIDKLKSVQQIYQILSIDPKFRMLDASKSTEELAKEISIGSIIY